MKTVVSEKGQVTIPKQIRDELGLVAGTTLHFKAENGNLVAVKHVSEDVFSKWRGKGKLPGGVSVDKYLADIRHDLGS